MPSPEIGLLLELVLDLKKDITVLREESTENKATLDEHARRSTSSEERLDRLEKRDQMLNGFFKISAGLLSAAGSVVAILEIIRRLH
jgi:hypothetical protein